MRPASDLARAVILGGSLVAGAVRADVPDPPHGTIPPFIVLGGAQSASGVPDPALRFTIEIRDFTNAPVPGADVVVDFSSCSDTRLCTAVVAGQSVQCPNRWVRGVTGLDGRVEMSVLGAGINDGATPPPSIAPGAGAGCITVYADGIAFSRSTAVLLDPNGALPGGNGVNGVDLAIATTDVGAAGLGAPYRGRTDYNQDGALNGADLARLSDRVGQSGLGQGSAAGCSGGGVAQPYCP